MKDVIKMKKLMVNYGGVLIFYIITILGVIYLCTPNNNVRRQNFKFTTYSETAK